MAAKKKGLAKFAASWAAKRARSNPSFEATGYQIVAAGAGYAGTRIGAAIAGKVIAPRWPSLSKHVDPAVSVGLFALAWWAMEKYPKWAKYRTAVLAGSAIAALQVILGTYFPSLAWMLGPPQTSDTATGDYQAEIAARRRQQQLPDADEDALFEEELEEEEYEPLPLRTRPAQPQPQAQRPAAPPPMSPPPQAAPVAAEDEADAVADAAMEGGYGNAGDDEIDALEADLGGEEAEDDDTPARVLPIRPQVRIRRRG